MMGTLGVLGVRSVGRSIDRRIRPILIAAAATTVIGWQIIGTSAPARGASRDYADELTLVQQPPPATRLSSTQGSRFSRSAEAEIRFQEGLLRYNTPGDFSRPKMTSKP